MTSDKKRGGQSFGAVTRDANVTETSTNFISLVKIVDKFISLKYNGAGVRVWTSTVVPFAQGKLALNSGQN